MFIKTVFTSSNAHYQRLTEVERKLRMMQSLTLVIPNSFYANITWTVISDQVQYCHKHFTKDDFNPTTIISGVRRPMPDLQGFANQMNRLVTTEMWSLPVEWKDAVTYTPGRPTGQHGGNGDGGGGC